MGDWRTWSRVARMKKASSKPKLDAQAKSFVPREQKAAAAPAPGNEERVASAKPCKFFANGNCKRGDQCKFSHAAQPNWKPIKPQKKTKGKAPARSLSELLKQDADESERHVVNQYACPFCEEKMPDVILAMHLMDEHEGDDPGQVCPLCAAPRGQEKGRWEAALWPTRSRAGRRPRQGHEDLPCAVVAGRSLQQPRTGLHLGVRLATRLGLRHPCARHALLGLQKPAGLQGVAGALCLRMLLPRGLRQERARRELSALRPGTRCD